MDRLAALRTFILVAERRSSTEAARTLRISPTAGGLGKTLDAAGSA
jgi:DNA-binding transcriptional LysR family regulator